MENSNNELKKKIRVRDEVKVMIRGTPVIQEYADGIGVAGLRPRHRFSHQVGKKVMS